MIGILYDALQIVPITLLGSHIVSFFFLPDRFGVLANIFTVCISLLIIVLKNTDIHQRLITAGVAAILFVGLSLILYRANLLDELIYNYMIGYAFALTILLTVAFIIVLKFPATKIILLLTIIITFSLCLARNDEIMQLDSALGYFYVLVLLAEIVQRYWKKLGDIDIRKHMVYISPFLIAIFVILLSAKSPKEPYDWHAAKSAWSKICEIATHVNEKLFHGSEEDFEGSVGFDGSGNVALALKSNDEPIFRVTAGKCADEVLYLRGKTYDTFDDLKWSKNDKSESKVGDETTQIKNAVTIYDEENADDYVKDTYLEISFLSYSTKYAFVPAFAFEVNDDRNSKYTQCVGNDLSFTDTKGHGDSYKVRFSKLNLDSDVFEDFVTYAQDNAASDGKSDIDAIRLYMPDNMQVSDSVKKLLDEITEGETDNYKKLKALEGYLSNLSYNRECASLPKSVKSDSDFLDYFLLESKEGSCTHYATAFVLLSRLMDIPARYVEGYYIYIPKSGTTDVKTSRAHAWPECYIDGIGWVLFDPTPGYKVNMGWKTPRDNAKGSSEEFFKAPIATNDTDIEEEPEESYGIRDIPVHVILRPLILAIVFIISFVIIDTGMRIRKINLCDKKLKALKYCKWNMNLLKAGKEGINESQTLDEYRKSIASNPDSNFKEFLEYIECYERLLYSDKDVSDKDEEIVMSNNHEIRMKLKQINKFKYYLHLARTIRKI